MKSMRYMPVVWTLLFALCHTAAAETQTVKISGSVDALYIYKENFDLRGGNDAAMVPLTDTVPGAPGTGASVTDSSDSADWFMSTLRVGIAAELSDNVSVVIGLFNQRDWNSNVFSGGTGGTSTGNAAEEFDLGVDMAYVTLKEAFYTPLTLILGRQEIEFGRGLMIGSPWDLDPQSTIAADEFTATYAFDAARAVLDFEPWTLDFVWANYAQGDANDRDSHSFLWINTHYQFSEYSAVWEGYFGADLDGNTADNTAALSDSVRANDNNTYTIGARLQMDPVSNMTIGTEIAHQWGDQSDSDTAAQFGLDRKAWLFDIFGEYRWEEHAYKPYIGLEYLYRTGDDPSSQGTYEGWNSLFSSPAYGMIHEYLEYHYQTALSGDPAPSTNSEIFFVSLGFSPMEDLQIDAQYYWFWLNEDIINSTHGGEQLLGGDLGTELDVSLTYAYTEEVTFTLGAAWFFPGDVYGSALTSDVDGAAGQGAVDTMATQFTAGVGVTF